MISRRGSFVSRIAQGCGASVWLALCVLVAGQAARAEGGLAKAAVAEYAALLEAYTRAVDGKVGTRVDYRGLLREPRWKALVESVGRARPAELRSRSEQLAFWINVYNIFAIDLILRHYPVESIRDIGSFFRPVWKREAGRIGGEPYTLDRIEHRILRPLGEARIHAAIVCASISCPNLLREPFRAEALEAQLDGSVRAWLLRPEKGMRVDREGKVLSLSRIFSWFDEDFEPEGGVLAFVTRYAPEREQAWLRKNGAALSIEYFEYDWGLNE